MVDVAIVGAGLAGLALGLSLEKQGISCAVYEYRPETFESGGSIAIAPNAARVLDHLGVYSRVRLQGYSFEEISFENATGGVLGNFLNGSQSRYGFAALRVPRTVLHHELLSACKSRDIPLYYGKRFSRIVSETQNGVTAIFEDGESITAEYIVGCDGIHSKVRQHIGDAEPTFSGLIGVMGSVRKYDLDSLKDVSDPKLPAMLFGLNGSIAIMPSDFAGDEIGYFATIEAEDRSREGWMQLFQNQAELSKMLANRFLVSAQVWTPLVKELCQKTPLNTLTGWPFQSLSRLENWMSSEGRVILVGDAAHAISPTGGQGSAMAFEDAETLAFTLRYLNEKRISEAVGRSVDDMKANLLKWQHHRQERIAHVIDFTSKNGALRKGSPHFLQQAAKEWLIWAMFKLIGPEQGASWLYDYSAESVLRVLTTHGESEKHVSEL